MAALEELHLSPPIAAALTRLGWSADDALTREAAPTAARGHNLVLVIPPSPTAATPALAGMLSRLGEGRPGLLLAPAGQLDEWGRVVHQALAASRVSASRWRTAPRAPPGGSGTTRWTCSSRRPRRRSPCSGARALRADALAAVLLAWPEGWEEEESVSPLMQDLDKEAQRIVLTSAPERAADTGRALRAARAHHRHRRRPRGRRAVRSGRWACRGDGGWRRSAT